MVFAGFVAICVGETISEMVQVFPVPNAAFNYVKYWLGDEDIAWAIGTLYWYAWATIFAQQMISAANLLGYWGPGRFWPCVAFYFWAPVALITLNLFPVDVSALFLLYFIDRSRVPDIVLTRIALSCYGLGLRMDRNWGRHCQAGLHILRHLHCVPYFCYQ
jgi:amino acid permease